jgi:hypothetical protein
LKIIILAGVAARGHLQRGRHGADLVGQGGGARLGVPQAPPQGGARRAE